MSEDLVRDLSAENIRLKKMVSALMDRAEQEFFTIRLPVRQPAGGAEMIARVLEKSPVFSG